MEIFFRGLIIQCVVCVKDRFTDGPNFIRVLRIRTSYVYIDLGIFRDQDIVKFRHGPYTMREYLKGDDGVLNQV